MEHNNSDTSDSESGSNKKLVRILIIVGIGIPVLVELLTLFNLVNVQLFEDDSELDRKKESIVEVRKLTEGDTLFADYASPVAVESMRIKVSAQEWKFELIFTHLNPREVEKFGLRIDSLKLNSGQILRTINDSEQKTESNVSRTRAEWKLPSGDIPQMLFLSSLQAISEDSTETIHTEVPIGNIPVRYSRD